MVSVDSGNVSETFHSLAKGFLLREDGGVDLANPTRSGGMVS